MKQKIVAALCFGYGNKRGANVWNKRGTQWHNFDNFVNLEYSPCLELKLKFWLILFHHLVSKASIELENQLYFIF